MNERQRHSPLANPTKEKYSSARKHKPDYWIFVLSGLLMAIGLVVVYSISPGLAASQHISQNHFIFKQLIDVLLGLVAFGIAAYIPLKVWLKIALPLVVVALISALIVMVTPIDEVYQAHRWIRFGGFSFQVAELIKLALLIYLAKFLSQRWKEGRLSDSRATLQPLLAILVILAVVVAKMQSDLGSAGVMIAIMAIMSFSVGIPLKKVAIIGGLIILFFALAISTSSYRRDRLSTFLHPGQDCKGNSYQICQALISVGSGGVFGQGLGYGVQAYGYLPESSNDSIFAIMAEKFGFVGTSAILVIYLVFFTRIKRVIERTKDQFSRLIAIGVLAWLSTQMIINIGAMIGLLPLKGITLPLISQGGTSLIFLTAALGIVFHISRYTSYSATEPNEIQRSPYNSFSGRRVGRPYNSTLTSRPRT